MSLDLKIMEQLTPRARISYLAHLYKACVKQHHKELIPPFSTLIPKDGVVIDAGAHAGQFTKLFAAMVPQGHVHSFEPNSYAYSILNKAMMIKGMQNVCIHRAGLSDAEGSLEISVPVKPSGSIGFGLSHFGQSQDDRPYLHETATVITLDHFVANHNLTRIDFIKADIEGWELRMLKGAEQAIDRFKPALFLEVVDGNLQRAGDDTQALWDFLTAKGYQGYQVENENSTLGQLASHADGDVLFVCE